MSQPDSSTYFWAVYGPAGLAYPAGDKLPPSRFPRMDPLRAPAISVIHPDATTPAISVIHPDATTPAISVMHPDTLAPLRITVGSLLDASPPPLAGSSLQQGLAGMRIRLGPFHATAEAAVAAMDGEWPPLAAQGALYAELCRLDTEFAQ